MRETSASYRQYLRFILRLSLGINLTIFSMPNSIFANAVGNDFQNFNPTSGGVGFVTVHNSKTLKKGVYNLGLYINHAINPLPEFDDENEGRGGQRNSITGLDLNMGIGLSKNLDIGINLPATIGQTTEAENERVQFAERGLNEIRVNSKYRLINGDGWCLAIVGTVT